MSPVSSCRGTFGRALANRLDRLRRTLNDLGERLQEAVAAAIGAEVGGAVRAAVRAVLDDAPGRPVVSAGPPWPPGRHPPFWGGADDRPDEESADLLPEGQGDDYGPGDSDPFPVSVPSALPEGRRQGRLAQALAFGLQVASWWLRRQAGRLPLLTALGLGAVTAAAAYLGRALLATRTGLARSAFGLAALADLVRAAAGAAAALGRRPDA
jgi:hypothetical protein